MIRLIPLSGIVWTKFTIRLPQEALDAGSIIIEFEFLSSDSAGAGWFIDEGEIRR